MEEKEVRLQAWRKEVQLLTLSIEIPDVNEYALTLLKVFNNKREERSILKIKNYDGRNILEVMVNMNAYTNECKDPERMKEHIEHLKQWLRGGLDIKLEDVKATISTAYLYEIDELDNNISDDDNYVEMGIIW